jgi:hypothetical protein
MQPHFLKMINTSLITKELHKIHTGPQSWFLPKINQSSLSMKHPLSEETELNFIHIINMHISLLINTMYNPARLVEWLKI